MAITAHEFGGKSLTDVQVFEYSDTLSLPVDKSTYGNSHIGDVVKVGDKYGILVTEIAPTNEEIETARKAIEAAGGVYVPQVAKTGGLNGPGYASVRVHGGVFNLTVEDAGTGAKVGATVYAKNSVSGGKTTLTTDKTSATAIGFLYNAIPASSSGASTTVVPVAFTA